MHKGRIAVAIKSCRKYAARRAAQLATWLPQLDCDFFFLIGTRTGDAVIEDSLACNVSDAFADIAPKVWCACRYALEENVNHLFVCDDDTYVVPSRLLKASFRTLDYVGFVRPYGDTANGNVPYIQGSAFWLSERAMERIVASNEMVPGIIDDGAVGRALYGKVPMTHDARYFPGPDYAGAFSIPDWISTHKCLDNQMQSVRNTMADKVSA